MHACPGPSPPQGCSRQARRLFGGACREEHGPVSAKDPIWTRAASSRLTHLERTTRASVIQAWKDIGGRWGIARAATAIEICLFNHFQVVFLNFLQLPSNIVLFDSPVLRASYIGICHRGKSRSASNIQVTMRALLQRPQASDHCNPQPPVFGSARQGGGEEEKRRRGKESQNKKNGV